MPPDCLRVPAHAPQLGRAGLQLERCPRVLQRIMLCQEAGIPCLGTSSSAGSPMLGCCAVLDEMVEACEGLGVQLGTLHAEYSASQYELSIQHTEAFQVRTLHPHFLSKTARLGRLCS